MLILLPFDDPIINEWTVLSIGLSFEMCAFDLESGGSSRGTMTIIRVFML